MKKWKEVRAGLVEEGKLNEQNITKHKKRLMDEVRAHKLAEIRAALDMTQVEISERLDVSQSRVSRIERGQLDQTQIATLRAYVEALGGELEMNALIGGERIQLS